MIANQVTCGLLLSLLLVSLCGCRDSVPRRHPVHGTVTLDGQPVDNATIIMTPKC